MKHHTNTTGPSADGFRRGLIHAINLAKANGTNQVLMKVHTLRNVGGVMEDVLGRKAVKTFKKKRCLTSDSVAIILETERVRSPFSRGVIFCPFGSLPLLTSCVSDARATDTVFVPWAEQEASGYQTMHPNSSLVP